MTYKNNGIVGEIWALSKTFEKELIELRHTFHQYPELSWKEVNTARRVAQLLESDGYQVKKGSVKTDVVADFVGRDNGKMLGIRADMDALPMYDTKEVSYASRVAGVMHACGHDVHMTIALGVAKILKQLKIDLPGKVRFIFQPSEETTPSGADELVRAGVMEGVDAIVAFHVDPEIDAGKIGVREGVLTANCNEFKLVIQGKSGHAARPHQSIDTIFLSQQILSALYDIVGKHNNPFSPAVLTIGKIQGGTKANIIPDRVEIAGTIRTIDDQTKNEITNAVEQRVHALTRASGGTYQLEFLAPVPSVVNDVNIARLVREAGTAALSQKNVVNIQAVSMGGEDFSWYLTKAPGALVRLGARKHADKVRYLHTPNFDIDEQAIAVGVATMTMIAINYLRN